MFKRSKKLVELKREWTTDGQGNVQSVTVPVSMKEIAEWAKHVKFVPSYFELVTCDKTAPDGLVFTFRRPAEGKDGGR